MAVQPYETDPIVKQALSALPMTIRDEGLLVDVTELEKAIYGAVQRAKAEALAQIDEYMPDYLTERWQPGEPIEVVGLHGSASKPGIVLRVEHEPKMHHYVVVQLDGEPERRINPDVLRHIKKPKAD